MPTWNELQKLDDTIAVIATREGVAFESDGMKYEADLRVYRNSDRAMARGATLQYFGGRDIYKICKDGTRGRKLVLCGVRKSQLGYAAQQAFFRETLAAMGVEA